MRALYRYNFHCTINTIFEILRVEEPLLQLSEVGRRNRKIEYEVEVLSVFGITDFMHPSTISVNEGESREFRF